MDAVITYVDGNDPVWKQDYEKYTNVPVMQKRFRDWGTLKYLLRGIEKKMPFIRNVYLVVSHPSQVPAWADKENLKIVLHKDIIPEEFLPTFNCNPIEMNLHRIPGLDEEYLYFNDDMFPVGDCRPTDFFRDGKAVIGYYRHLFASNMYKKICRNSDRLARHALGLKPSAFFTRPQHICSPMLKSVCDEVYDTVNAQIRETSATRTRTENNLNQYLFLDYMNYKGLVINEKISNKHFSVSVASPESLRKFLQNPTRNLVCINDVHLSEKRYDALRGAILEAFESVFPDKSRFEL
ncbi:MAG: hypothetical protein IKU36_08590 [Bacteroidales bacterium]|nr:hypothetical protein [Bacteroidales bacterium]